MARKGRSAVDKGKKFERLISKKMSTAFKTNVSRTPMSGSWRGTNNEYNTHEDNRLLGDLFFPLHHPLNIFNMELKNHDDIKLRTIFINGVQIQDFIEQVVTDAKRKVGYSVPMLIIHISHEDDYVILPYQKDMYKSAVKQGFPIFRSILHAKDKMHNKTNYYDCIITDLSCFMNQSVSNLAKWYAKVDWDCLNKEQITVDTEDTDSELDKAITNVANIITKDGGTDEKDKTIKH